MRDSKSVRPIPDFLSNIPYAAIFIGIVQAGTKSILMRSIKLKRQSEYISTSSSACSIVTKSKSKAL